MKKILKTKVAVQEKVEKQTPQCHHFWVIEVANGPSSRGSCKYCGEKKEFLNAFPTFNPLRKGPNFLNMPTLPKVEMDKDSES